MGSFPGFTSRTLESASGLLESPSRSLSCPTLLASSSLPLYHLIVSLELGRMARAPCPYLLTSGRLNTPRAEWG